MFNQRVSKQAGRMNFIKLLSTLCIVSCLVPQGLRNVVIVRADVSGSSSSIITRKGYQRNPFQRSPLLQTNTIVNKTTKKKNKHDGRQTSLPKSSQIMSTRKSTSFGIRGGSDENSEDEYKKALFRTLITVSSAGTYLHT